MQTLLNCERLSLRGTQIRIRATLFKMENLNSKWSQMRAAFSLGLVFIFVGIPLWWKTTEVYRADLPYSQIQELAENTKLSTEVRIKIITNSETTTAAVYDLFLNSNADSDFTFINLNYEFQNETIPDEDFQTLWSTQNDEKITSDHDILVVLATSPGAEGSRILLSKKKTIYVEMSEGIIGTDLKNAVETVMKLIGGGIVNAEGINHAMSKAYGAKLDFSEDRELHMRKTVQPDKGHDIIFSLICPEPDKLQASWDIQRAVELYLKPMITKLGSYAEFHIGSQVLYYSGLSVKPKRKTEGNTTHFYLTHQQIPHVVNPIESRLGAQISPNPTLNFVIYMTEDRYLPLYIQREDERYSTTNTFLVPRWGAIMIKNVDKSPTGAEVPRKVELESVEFMEIFIAQLRSLLGIEILPKLDNFTVESQDPGAGSISDLEMDYLVRVRIAQNIATSIHTLNSLAQLLEKIENIVINDKVAEHVYSAVLALHNAINAFEDSKLEEALHFSNEAFKASEIAFFDPTLLELLYFPEDQKFAIYIPLFLPISLPLLTSLFNAIKLWKAERKKAKEKDE